MIEQNKYIIGKRKICFIVSSINTVNAFLIDHIVSLSTKFDVYLVANCEEESLNEVVKAKICGFRSIKIEREINLFFDMRAVYSLYKYFQEMRFYAIHSVTPKAGLINALAGSIAKIPFRIHIFTGQVWATKKGLLRYLLMSIDILIAGLNNKILVDGESQRRFLIQHNILKENKTLVLANGSISGVNINRFKPDSEVRRVNRNELNISSDKIVYIYLGRLKSDKGIFELLDAFNKLAQHDKNVFLLIVGEDEEDILFKLSNYPMIINGINFYFYGRAQKVEDILQVGDVFCLPSYREGFSVSVIEASCSGLPVICSDIYGINDTMIDGITGLKCKAHDSESLYNMMKSLSTNSLLRNTLGQNGREFVVEKFSGEIVTKAWVEYYNNL